jgi:hypothetical protein
MTDAEFDAALVAAFFRLAGEEGWRNTTVAGAAQSAALPLTRARERFPNRASVLLRFGRMADMMALEAATGDGSVRERLFDLLMRRFDALQPHRAGVIALLHALPFDPPLAALLSCATHRSMRWMLQAAEVPAAGLRGMLQVRGLTAVWLWALRTWERDDSPDLSGTMAVLDTALSRAERAAAWLGGRGPAGAEPEPPPAGDPSEVPADEPSQPLD